MISLWKSAIINSINKQQSILINRRFIHIAYRLCNNTSDKQDNECCTPPSPSPCCVPPPPPCCPPPPPPCCPPSPPPCCPPSPTPCCSPSSSQTRNGPSKTMDKSKKQYTLMTDLAKKGCEIIKLIVESNEYDLAKEKIKMALNMSYAYVKHYGGLITKNVTQQMEKRKPKDAKSKIDERRISVPKQPPTKK